MKHPSFTLVIAAALVVSASAPAVAVGAPPTTTPGATQANASPRAITVALRGLPSSYAPTVTITGPGGFRQQVKLARAAKTATVRLPANGAYAIAIGNIGKGSGLYYPDVATTRVTISAKTPRATVTRQYQPARLTFSGLGNLRLGMTLQQARQADPSLRVRSSDWWVEATTSLAQKVVFNGPRQGGRLAFLVPRNGISTAQGLRVGDPDSKARAIYKYKRTRVSTDSWDYIAVARDYLRRKGKEASGNQFPRIGIHFTERGPTNDEMQVDIRRERVRELHLDGGQQCFS